MRIPHRVVEAQKNFDQQVVAPMVADYAAGRTPNPCAHCNALVKFPLLWRAAREEGCQALATGHYVGIEQVDGRFYFAEAIDQKKSQAYFLARMEAKYLTRLLFPLGCFTKENVRQMAAKAGMKNANRPESQDLCFLPANGLDELMRARKSLRHGPLEDEQGRVLGQHQGLHRFTIGQRRGLGVALGSPGMYYHWTESGRPCGWGLRAGFGPAACGANAPTGTRLREMVKTYWFAAGTTIGEWIAGRVFWVTKYRWSSPSLSARWPRVNWRCFPSATWLSARLG